LRHGRFDLIVQRIRFKHEIGKQQGISSQPRQMKSLKDVMKQFHPFPRIPHLKTEKPIDIIIPVYNGFEFLSELFSRLLSEQTVPVRLIVVDDCSPDNRCAGYISGLASSRPDILFIRNKTNQGFVKSVNMAVQHARNHFVILNTDVLPPKNWLERLMVPIFHGDKIASTTPFTNSGVICSFPDFLQDNELYEGLSVDELDTYFQSVHSETIRFEIPTGVGFCMGINKDAVDRIGMFDDVLFGKGYGEENDWCMRAHEAGFKNIMVSDLFVYHRHGGSFSGKEKQRLQDENLKKMYIKHPGYSAKVQEFIAEDPGKSIRDFIILWISATRKKVALIIDHTLGGGANQYREKIIAERLHDNQCVLLLSYDIIAGRGFELTFLGGGYSIGYDLGEAEDIRLLYDYIKIHEIIVNELATFEKPLQILALVQEIKERYNARLTVPIHDYFSICPSLFLLNDSLVYCDVPGGEECLRCIHTNKAEFIPIRYTDIEKWREKWGSFLTITDEITCFSNSSKQIVLKAYPYIDQARFFVKPHMVDDMEKIPHTNRNDGVLNLGILGVLTTHKGSGVVRKILDIIDRENLPVKIILIGESQEKIQSRHLIVTGAYKRSELPEIVMNAGIDMFFVPSICPETFSFTTEEIIGMGLPVAVFNLGAPAEKISYYPKGLVIDGFDPSHAIKSIMKFWKNESP